MASFSSSSSSSSLASQSYPWRYDVFINFRGEDTRRSFSRNLYDALCRRALLTFIDDDELERGEEIAESLVQAIQESNVAVIVFSKDYASSTWCLDELVKIIECHQTRGQIIIPIFYEVNPSHLRKQSNDVAAAFERHEQNPRNTHKIQNWRDALTKTANLSGWDSKEFRYDHMLISKIVEDISKKLKKSIVSNGDELLVGVASHFMQIKNRILSVEGLDVCIIGIWGMGGIGKTTIAEFIFKRLSFEFEGCCLLKDVRERSKVKDLRKELISQLLGEKYRGYAFPKTRLGRRRALIVLDDVDDSQQLDSLIGDPCWFGSQSVIIITGRDKQVIGRRAGFLYKVEPLEDEEALRLFSRSAFKQNYPRYDYESLSSSIVKYAQGNPLALKVLGSSLSGKTEKEWESALKKLSKGPNKNIQDVLQISYDRLDGMEKDIFLHIACFFKGENKDVVMTVFERCEFDADIIVSVLVDKCFVNIFRNTLQMHDLMQEMGKEIVRQESKYPNKRSRLWDPKDVFKVLAQDKGAEAVESIMVDVSKISKIDLNPEVFMKTPNLKFLKFYVPNRQDCFEGQNNLHLPKGLDYLPNELTYFHWDGYPLESFPHNFQPNHLIVLGLPNSKIKRFQEQVKDENMGYLVAFHMKFGMVLRRFCSLIKIPSYTYGWQMGKVTSLSLVGCKNVSHLPSSGVGLLEAVEKLILWDCKNLNTFPEVSSNIKYMDLGGTAIKQIPSSSVEHLGKLEELRMFACDKLESLPSNFFDSLTSLRKLNLMCRSLKKLPEISENMYSLQQLVLYHTDLPSSIGNLKGLKSLYICVYPKLTFVPKGVVNLVSLESVHLVSPTFDPVEKHHDPVIDSHLLPLLLEGTSSLQSLTLVALNLTKLPKNLSFLSSVTSLDLRGNNFERITPTIKQLSNLTNIDISCCQRLISLPEFPSSVISLKAHNCISLEQIQTLKQLVLGSEGVEKRFCLWNCPKLDEDECQEIADLLLGYHKPWVQYCMHYPGSRIPEWIEYQSMGDSVEVPIPSHWLNRGIFRVALCLCVRYLMECLWDGDFYLRCDCYFGDNCHAAFDDTVICVHGIENPLKDHVIVVFHDIFCDWIDGNGYSLRDVALFKFSLHKYGRTGSIEILKCGVTPLYSQDQDEFYQALEFPTPMSMVKIEEDVVYGS